MSLSPDQERQEILRRAPFVRTLLDTSAQNSDTEAWAKNLSLYRDSVAVDMNARLGNYWFQNTIMPLFFAGEALRVLNPEKPRLQRLNAVTGFVTAGFEIGDQAKTDLFLVDIISTYARAQHFNPRVLNDTREALIATDYVSSLLQSGAYLKETPRIDNTGNKPTPLIDDFLNGLDLREI